MWVASAPRANIGEFDVAVEGLNELQLNHAAQHARWRFIRNQRQFSRGAGRTQRIDSCGLSFFAENPDLLEQMVETDLIVGSRRASAGGAAVGGVRERAEHWMVRPLLQAVVMQVAVLQLDAAIGLPRDIGIVRDH